ncbi:unnamed protein product, partial [Hapterophycus canaliculatus]
RLSTRDGRIFVRLNFAGAVSGQKNAVFAVRNTQLARLACILEQCFAQVRSVSFASRFIMFERMLVDVPLEKRESASHKKKLCTAVSIEAPDLFRIHSVPCIDRGP